MKEIIYSIVFIIIGMFFLFFTYKDGEKKEVNLTTSYVSHIKGYLAGFGFIILGVLKLFGYLK